MRLLVGLLTLFVSMTVLGKDLPIYSDPEIAIHSLVRAANHQGDDNGLEALPRSQGISALLENRDNHNDPVFFSAGPKSEPEEKLQLSCGTSRASTAPQNELCSSATLICSQQLEYTYDLIVAGSVVGKSKVRCQRSSDSFYKTHAYVGNSGNKDRCRRSLQSKSMECSNTGTLLDSEFLMSNFPRHFSANKNDYLAKCKSVGADLDRKFCGCGIGEKSKRTMIINPYTETCSQGQFIIRSAPSNRNNGVK